MRLGYHFAHAKVTAFPTMKTTFTLLCALTMWGAMSIQPAFAEDAAPETTETEPLPAVPAALKDKTFVNNAKLNTKAKVYFIYKSRSTCGICVAECPAIVATYKQMQKTQEAEIVMLNGDEDAKTAAKWARKAKMKFPVVAPGEGKGVPFPYSGPNTLPFMVAVDAEGKKLGQANAQDVAKFVADWQKYLPDQGKKKKGKK